MVMKNQNGIMISCKKATELVELKQLKEINLTQRLKLKLHLLMCTACQEYEKQCLLINNFLKRKSENYRNLNFTDEELNVLKDKVKSKL